MKASTIILLALVLGCGRTRGEAGISDSQFIEVMTELRRAALAAGGDTAQFLELRTEILETHGVTESDVRGYVDDRSADLAHMAEIWDSVGARLTTRMPDPVLDPVIDSMPQPPADSIAGEPDSAAVERVRPQRVRGAQ